jgi:hypothetical protein
MAHRSAVARLARGLWPAAAVALLGAVLLALPAGRALEQGAGLSWLYALRGVREPPADVSIIAIDARAAAALGLPRGREVRCEVHLVLRLGRESSRLYRPGASRL